MDLFRFTPTTSFETIFERGVAINGITSAMWVERYRTPGEFQIKAKLSAGLIGFLEVGDYISHTRTYEVMVVENIEIIQDKDKDPDVIFSGRSLPSLLEQRVVGMNQVRATTSYVELPMSPDYIWNQVVWLINTHTHTATSIYDQFPSLLAYTSIPGTGLSEARTIKRMDLLKATVDLLAISDLGLRTTRISLFPETSGNNTQTLFVVYKGEDKTASVVFSWDRGDIDGANYLWSNKNNKTGAVVVGSKYNVVQDDSIDFSNGATWGRRRTAVVDGTDIDNSYVFDAGTINALIAKMKVRAREAVQINNDVQITRLDIAQSIKYFYRTDYNLGDLVMVEANYNVRNIMRVVEHVEILDETGRSAHPTLAFPTA